MQTRALHPRRCRRRRAALEFLRFESCEVIMVCCPVYQRIVGLEDYKFGAELGACV